MDRDRVHAAQLLGIGVAVAQPQMQRRLAVELVAKATPGIAARNSR